MAVFYFPRDQRFDFNTPQFTRRRHRYRGPRESEKINLEIQQFCIATKHINTRTADFRQDLMDRKDTIYQGSDIQGPTFADGGPIDIDGLINMYSKLDELRKRVSYLEA